MEEQLVALQNTVQQLAQNFQVLQQNILVQEAVAQQILPPATGGADHAIGALAVGGAGIAGEVIHDKLVLTVKLLSTKVPLKFSRIIQT